MSYWRYPYHTQPLRRAKYQLIEKIGEGANGQVYKARSDDNVVVAIKYLAHADPKSRERFQNEVRIYLKLQACPFVVKILDFSLDPLAPFLVMEFCKSGNARSQHAWFINNSRDGIRLLLGIADAVGRFHDLDTYHRDIKPDNLLMDTDLFGNFTLKLGDAGMSCLLPDQGSILNATYSLQGTPTYIAPELLQGETFSAASDVFSLGVTMHELLAGERPHAGQRIISGPVEMQNLIQRMIDPNPRNRPTIHETIAGMNVAFHQISARQNINEFVGGILKAGALLGGIFVGISALDYLLEGE
jgi:serine/threonine protein kinase